MNRRCHLLSKTFFLLIVLSAMNVMDAMAHHNHTPFFGGQVGMSESYHIEFVTKKEGEYRLYVTDLQRRPVDVSNAIGTLVINPDEANPESLLLFVNDRKEFLGAKGKSRHIGEAIMALVQVEIPGKDSILIDYQEKIGQVYKKTEKIKIFKEFVCEKRHLFSLSPKEPTCPIDGTVLKEMQIAKKVFE